MKDRHPPQVRRDPGHLQLRQQVHDPLDRRPSRSTSKSARRAIRSTPASRRSWTPPAASTSSASATARRRTRRRPRPDAPDGPRRREKGSFGCLFRSRGRVRIRRPDDHARPPTLHPRAGRPGRGEPVGARIARSSSSGSSLLCARVGRARPRRPRSVEDRRRDVVRRRRRNGCSAATCVVPHLAGEPYARRGRRSSTRLAALGVNAVLAAAADAQRRARSPSGLAARADARFTALASRELNGRAFRWLPVLILVGCVGFWDRAHALSPELGLTLGVAIGALRIRAGAAHARWRAASCSALGIGDRVPGARLHGPAVARRDGAAAARVRPQWRTRALRRRRWPSRSRVAAAACRCRGRSRSHARDPALFAAWWRARVARPTTSRRCSATARRSRRTTCKNLPWFAWPVAAARRSGCCGCAAAASTAACAAPGIVVPGRARARDARRPRRDAGAAAASARCRCSCRSRSSPRSRSIR